MFMQCHMLMARGGWEALRNGQAPCNIIAFEIESRVRGREALRIAYAVLHRPV